MPVLKASASDYTAFIKATAQYVGAGSSAVVSKSGAGMMAAPPGLGASVRASYVGLKSSPSTSTLSLLYINPPATTPSTPGSGSGSVPPFVVSLNPLPVTTGPTIFVARYTPAGVPQWSLTLRGMTNLAVSVTNGATSDSTGIYVVGGYRVASAFPLTNSDGSNSGRSLPASFNLTAPDAFIVKYSPSGVVQWATVVQGTNLDAAVATVFDSTGVYLTGHYRSTNTVALINGDGTTSVVPPFPVLNFQSTYLIKYTPTGTVQWRVYMGLPSAGSLTSATQGAATDSTGVYVCGQYNSFGEVPLYNSDDSTTQTLLAGGETGNTAFLIKYDRSGFLLWHVVVKGDQGDRFAAVTTDSTGVYVVGFYLSSVIPAIIYNGGVTPTPTGNTFPINTLTSGLVIKYNSDGVVQWYTYFTGTGSTSPSVCATDSTGVYIGGQYTSTEAVVLTNGDGSNPNKSLPASLAADTYIIKYSTAGAVQWYLTIRGITSVTPTQIATDSTGVYLSGSYVSSSTVPLTNSDGLNPSNRSLPSSASGVGFTIKYSTLGVVQWSTTVEGTSVSTRGVSTDGAGLYTVGSYLTASPITLVDAV